MRRNIRLTIAYNGAAYLGWQHTKEGPSIESTLQAALEKLLRHPVILQAASRTDCGVHAAGQVANFYTENDAWELGRLQRALNGTLPHDMAITAIDHVEDSFHPTLEVYGKEYHYFVCYGHVQLPQHRHTSWHIHHDLNFLAMRQAMTLLTGEHDFQAFCNQRKHLVYPHYTRTVRLFEMLELPHDRQQFIVEGPNFLYKMVRNLVGTVLDIGKGRIPLADLPSILESRDRARAGVTAAAHGLTLARVSYAEPQKPRVR